MDGKKGLFDSAAPLIAAAVILLVFFLFIAVYR